jgi:hypothetical protein
MSIKESLLNSCLHDLTVCQHLATKFAPENADWRPRENMRSTVELMQYLSFVGMAFTQQFISAPEDRDLARNNYRTLAKLSSDGVNLDNFAEWIEREKDAIREAFSTISEAGLSRPTYHPFSGDESTLFDALLTTTKYIAAYRQQLFLYAKMLGANVNTRNNWYGLDSTPAPAAKAA